MSQTTYLTLSLDEIRDMDDSNRMHVLETLVGPEQIAVQAVSSVMPYFAAQRAAERHVDNCTACSNGSFWDMCPEGDALFRIASDACAAQDDLAAQN